MKLLAFATFGFAAVAPALATAAPAGPASDDSYLVGVTFGAASSEAFAYAGTPPAFDGAYKIGFRFGADLYRDDGPVTHVFSFALATTSSYADTYSFKALDFTYGVPIYFTSGRLRPAVRPFAGGHFFVGENGGSQGQLGVLGGARLALGTCSFSDVYAGWRGRYRAIPTDQATEEEGWKSAFVVHSANTISIIPPVCFYIVAAVEMDFTQHGLPADATRGKPTFAFAAGPAVAW